MKIKSIVKYYLYEVKTSVLIFYLIMLISCIATFVGFKLSDGELHSAGLELASIIFLFVLGLNLFKSQFHFLIQNGVSRKANLIGFIISTIIVIVFALLDSIASVTMHNLIGYESLFNLVYENGSQVYGFMYILKSILFFTPIYGSFLMLGYFISSLYYAMNKAWKIIVSAGVPVFLFLALPLIDYFLNLDIERKLGYIISNMLGVYNTNTANILNPILSCVVIYAILSSLTYIITRKISVK